MVKLQKENLKYCLELNLTLSQMAERLDCNSATVTSYLKKFGLKSKFKKEIKLDMNELYKLRVISRWNYSELAELYKVSITTIMKTCNKFKFPKIKTDYQDSRCKKVTVKKTKKMKKDWKLKPLVNKKQVNKNTSKLLNELYAML